MKKHNGAVVSTDFRNSGIYMQIVVEMKSNVVFLAWARVMLEYLMHIPICACVSTEKNARIEGHCDTGLTHEAGSQLFWNTWTKNTFEL